MDLAKGIKMLAQQQANASVSADIVFGKVVSTSPLAVKIDQKLTIDSEHLLLTGAVEERKVTIHFAGNSTGSISIEGSEYRSFKSNLADNGTLTLQRGLEVGEKVLMLRQRGGQMYVILDRVVSA